MSGFLLWRCVRTFLSVDQYTDLALYLLIGILVGARLGFALLYNLTWYIAHPMALVMPFDEVTGLWVGISGMSYYGGAVGVIIALCVFAWQYKVSVWRVADVVALCAPIGYFFGRLGNFVNGELFGRVTSARFGMYFPNAMDAGESLRHPSQLYEAFGEGIVLGLMVAYVHQKSKQPGRTAAAYLIGYGIIRFCVEFFREPDAWIGLTWQWMTLGQMLSALFAVIGIFLWRVLSCEKICYNDSKRRRSYMRILRQILKQIR